MECIFYLNQMEQIIKITHDTNHILKKLFAVCFGWLPKTRTTKTQKIVLL